MTARGDGGMEIVKEWKKFSFNVASFMGTVQSEKKRIKSVVSNFFLRGKIEL